MIDTSKDPETWRDVLTHLGTQHEGAFGADFLAAYGERLWQPNDADGKAAHSLHVELISRIATQFLGYSDGVEERALTSIFDLFARARSITEANPGGTAFETLIWHVLNSRVRPFTAKWHPKSVAGALRALDSSDEFRADLTNVQAILVELDRLLQLLKGEVGYVAGQNGRPDHDAIDKEMAKSVQWRPMGADPADRTLAGFAEAEKTAVMKRRAHYLADADRPWAAGLALSGGGIRSATFSLGVMVSLAKRNLVHQFDYLSTVSGGGYAGSFLTQLLGQAADRSGLSLAGADLPFARDEGESQILRRIRQGASYLSGSFFERLAVAMAQAHGVFINLLVLTFVAAAFAYADFALRSLIPDRVARLIAFLSPFILAVVFVLIPFVRKKGGASKHADAWMAALGVVFLLPILWVALGAVHSAWQPLAGYVARLHHSATEDVDWVSTVTKWLAALGSASALAGALVATFGRIRPLLLTSLTFVFFILLEALLFNLYERLGILWATAAFTFSVALAAGLWRALDVNSTSLHHYYRAKLAAAFLIDRSLAPADPLRLSEFEPTLAHFPIINCALNAPGSKSPSMRGRLSDVFALTPVAIGAPILGYNSTSDWETANPDLDLATAMALSALQCHLRWGSGRHGTRASGLRF